MWLTFAALFLVAAAWPLQALQTCCMPRTEQPQSGKRKQSTGSDLCPAPLLQTVGDADTIVA